jgi:hypothetical protein
MHSMTAPTLDEGLDFTGSMGAEAAEEAAASQRTAFRRPDYFRLKDGEQELVRLLSDRDVTDGHANQIPWITVLMHGQVPTKPKPEKSEGNWPQSMSAVCRGDKVFKARYPDGCPICVKHPSNKAKPRTFALLVLRDEIREGGRLVGVKDKTRKVPVIDDDGKPVADQEVEVPDVRLVDQSWYGFFGKLSAMSARWGTLADRDMLVKRKGGGKTDTEYIISADDPFEVPDPSDPSRTIKYDLRNPVFFARYAEMGPDLVPDLRVVVAERASDAYYWRFFGLGKAPEGEEAGSNGQSAQPAAPRTEADPEQVRATQADIMKRLQKPAEGDGQAAEPTRVMAQY